MTGSTVRFEPGSAALAADILWCRPRVGYGTKKSVMTTFADSNHPPETCSPQAPRGSALQWLLCSYCGSDGSGSVGESRTGSKIGKANSPARNPPICASHATL